jgi:hypothetical protein
VVTVAEPDVVGVFVPDNEEGPMAQAAMMADKAMSANQKNSDPPHVVQ